MGIIFQPHKFKDMRLSLPTRKRQWVVAWIFLCLATVDGTTVMFGTPTSPVIIAIMLFGFWGVFRIFTRKNPLSALTLLPAVIGFALGLWQIAIFAALALYFLMRKL